MSYTVDFSMYMRDTSLSLAAQLVEYDGDNIGSEITSGFIELGNGWYGWRCTTVPDDFAGHVKFYPQGDSTDITVGHLDPACVERIDAKISSIPTAAGNADAVCDEALSGHTAAGTVGEALSSI